MKTIASHQHCSLQRLKFDASKCEWLGVENELPLLMRVYQNNHRETSWRTRKHSLRECKSHESGAFVRKFPMMKLHFEVNGSDEHAQTGDTLTFRRKSLTLYSCSRLFHFLIIFERGNGTLSCCSTTLKRNETYKAYWNRYFSHVKRNASTVSVVWEWIDLSWYFFLLALLPTFGRLAI